MGVATRAGGRLPAVEYPASDGKPMAETDLHRDAIMDLLWLLKRRFEDQDQVYVSANNLIYYQEGDPSRCFSPDVYVVVGVPKRARRVYKLWEEGRPPSVVFEISSRSTVDQDLGDKRRLCARLGVSEYFLFDPERDCLEPPLQGFRRAGRHLLPMEPDASGALESKVLGLRLEAEGPRIRCQDLETGRPLLGMDEAGAELGRLQAELRRLRGEE
jgi:Uma2 family endonuclease